MLLAIDIGNTNISFAMIDAQGGIRVRHAIRTSRPRIPAGIIRQRKKVDKISMVSVVPKALKKIKKILKNRFKGTEILIAGDNLKIPLGCAYNKKQVGKDRLVTSYAAKILYGLPILAIDFGTAVTFDVVSKKSVYIGGLIVPGIKMSLESLSERTAMLPKTYLKRTRSFIAKDTASSIRNGMIYGYSALCEGLIGMFKKKVDKAIKVVATGGDASLMSRYAPSIRTVDPDLSLKGLYFITRYQNT